MLTNPTFIVGIRPPLKCPLHASQEPTRNLNKLVGSGAIRKRHAENCGRKIDFCGSGINRERSVFVALGDPSVAVTA
ncbi:hypothetical protein MTO96_039490 [Rhipicephalus appendiculatus]